MPRSEHDNWTISSVKSGHLRSVICGRPTSALTTCAGCAHGQLGLPLLAAHSPGRVSTAADAAGIVAASGYLQHLTQWTQWVGETQRPHERVPGSCAFAKYAVAFFKMSHSIRASASSRLSRDSSASSSVTGRRFSPSVASWPRRACPTQFFSVLPDMLRRLAASAIGTCCARTSCTACSRNSFVYCCRGNDSIPDLQTSDCRLKASTFSSLAQAKPYRSEAHRRLVRTNELCRCSAPAAGVGGMAADEERVGGRVARRSLRGVVDPASGAATAVAPQDAPLHQPD